MACILCRQKLLWEVDDDDIMNTGPIPVVSGDAHSLCLLFQELASPYEGSCEVCGDTRGVKIKCCVETCGNVIHAMCAASDTHLSISCYAECLFREVFCRRHVKVPMSDKGNSPTNLMERDLKFVGEYCGFAVRRQLAERLQHFIVAKMGVSGFSSAKEIIDTIGSITVKSLGDIHWHLLQPHHDAHVLRVIDSCGGFTHTVRGLESRGVSLDGVTRYNPLETGIDIAPCCICAGQEGLVITCGTCMLKAHPGCALADPTQHWRCDFCIYGGAHICTLCKTPERNLFKRLKASTQYVHVACATECPAVIIEDKSLILVGQDADGGRQCSECSHGGFTVPCAWDSCVNQIHVTCALSIGGSRVRNEYGEEIRETFCGSHKSKSIFPSSIAVRLRGDGVLGISDIDEIQSVDSLSGFLNATLEKMGEYETHPAETKKMVKSLVNLIMKT